MLTKQLGELTVGDCMTPQAIVIDASTRLSDAIRVMESERLSVLPVVRGGELAGILSTSDLLEVIRELQSDLSSLEQVDGRTREFLISMLLEQGDTTRVHDVMTAPAVTVRQGVNLVVAARLLVEQNCHHLPVVDADNTPVGVLAAIDFVQAFAEHGASLAG